LAAAGVTARLRGGESVEEAVAAAVAAGAEAVLFNCSTPEVMADAVSAAVAAARGTCVARVGVYANGFSPMPPQATANAGYSTLREELTPERYVSFAHEWAARGASIIGGCCGIGAEHIRALSQAAL
jgi:S-methylmethionine-dependent homocysteine/selenocysteine methylase